MNSPHKAWYRIVASGLAAVTLSVTTRPLAYAAPLIPTGGEVANPTNTGLIVGLILGGIAVVAGLFFLILFLKRRKKDDEPKTPSA